MKERNMRISQALIGGLALIAAAPGAAATDTACKLTPKEVVTSFVTEFYVEKKVRAAFETWVDPGYIQHNPMAATGREAAIAFLEPFVASHPAMTYSIKRIMADGNLVAVHSRGSFTPGDRGFAVVDILRVEGCRVMEHWDVVQPVPDTAANQNGMF
jgi:predicted SnoaL-like aldol condensation-catalyzing enzyme